MIHPILLTVWAVLAICFMALLVYRGQLTRYEDEQLFLHHDDTSAEQDRSLLVRRVKQLEPILNLAGAAAALVTVCVIGIYVYGAWKGLH
jgi:hypothetical protein